ncbi:MAG: hypothetical protein HY040_24295 [Planctomycetes bacterium]|nr:hypothetical protein [Planctomycetota bacterium]
MSSEQALEAISSRGKLGRASRYPGQLWQAPTFLLGLGIFLSVALTSPLRQAWSSGGLLEAVVELRHKLELGAERPEILVLEADNLATRSGQLPRRAAEINFLAGSAYYRLAQSLPPDQAGQYWPRVLQYLEEASALGISVADMPAQNYRLGVAILQQDKTSRRALDLISTSVEKGAERPADGYAYLIDAYLHMPKPRLDLALIASQKQLDLIDDRDVEAVSKARLLRVEILMRKELRPEALVELERISPKTSKAMRVKARLLQTELYEEDDLWTRAIPAWKELLPEAELVPGGKARILNALGLCYVQTDPRDDAQAIKAWQEALTLGGQDGQAAGLRLGALLLQQDPPEFKEALAAWREALAKVRIPSDYQNKRLDVERVRLMFEAACNRYLENHDYERTQEVAVIYKSVAAPGIAEERLAQAAESQARELKEKSKLLSDPAAKEKRKEANSQFQRAAVAYEQAAAVRNADAQPGPLWRSALCYLEAADYTQARNILERFIKLDLVKLKGDSLDRDENRLAEAWLYLAESREATGLKELAQEAYWKCIEFPNTPFAGRARYQLALAEIEKKNLENACDILKQNLSAQSAADSSATDAEAQEKSLYKLADVFWEMQKYDQACLYLEKAVKQYRANAQVLVYRDRLADGYLRLGKQDNAKLQAATGEDVRAYIRRTRNESLQRGHDVFQRLADDLEAKSKANPLTAVELDLLRKARFGAADTRFEQDDFSEALRRYQILQETYRAKAEGLIAFNRIWKCVPVMVGIPQQERLVHDAARAALQKAQADLKEMSADDPGFRGPGVWPKDVWLRHIEWVNSELNPTTPSPAPPQPSVK